VEFKRPGRKDYDANENPQHQIESYIKKLLGGNELDVDGRPIKINPESTAFYCYIVADRVGKMNEWTFTWEDTPDGRGKFYEPKNGFKGRVEVVGWDDLVGDARERNSIFFERVGLKPTNFFTD
jgi:hypothetical protein